MLDRSTPPATDPLDEIGLIIFDCDGVLIDSEPIASSTLAESMRAMGVAITDRQAHEKYTGNAIRIIRAMIEQEYAVDGAALFALWHEKLYPAFAERLSAMPGMLEVVSGLGRPKCVASNSGMDRLKRSLGHLELWGQFAPHVFSADAVQRPKPAPDLLYYCALEFGVEPDRCVMIDDSPHGVEAAVAAGMLCIGFVDPNDPRPGRSDVLMAAGALVVAQGAGELREALSQANRVLAKRPVQSVRHRQHAAPET